MVVRWFDSICDYTPKIKIETRNNIIKLMLDERKIRKGRPIGLPYQGSKKKVSKKIVEIIKQNFDTNKPIYDIFGGGGAITAECLINGLEVHYNDLDNTITGMLQRVLSTDREFLKTLIVSRDEFSKIRDEETKTVDDELKLLVNSFGNNRITYLYNKDISDIKYNLAKEIIKKHDVFSGYRKTETYIKSINYFKNKSYQKSRLQRLERLEQFQRLQQLERLQNVSIENLEITNYDYKHFSYLTNTIIYLDPPYENTYLEGYSIDTFDSKAFYDWAYEMSKKNIVLISSYEISDNRFECVYEFKTARSTFYSGSRGNQTEKLFQAHGLLLYE